MVTCNLQSGFDVYSGINQVLLNSLKCFYFCVIGEGSTERPHRAVSGGVYRSAQHVYRDGVLPEGQSTGRTGERTDQTGLDVPVLAHAGHFTGQCIRQSKRRLRGKVTFT